MKRTLLLILTLLCITAIAYSQGYHVRIGTIGNSITHGNSLADPEHDAYPIQLHEMLQTVYGDTCIVRNFGLTTTTMLKNGDVSYWDTQHLIDYLAWAPEICFIMLGTNDTKPQNWDVYGDEFIGDYLSMIDTVKQRNPSTQFILAYPPPAFEEKWGIRDSIIVNGIIPAIDSVLKVIDAELMDFYHPLLDSVHLFIDNIHPNVEGNTVMARLLMEEMIDWDIVHKADTGLTFITSFVTDNSIIALNDSAVLSWTSINADSAFLNDVKVAVEGTLKISPPDSTLYTLIAMGERGNDTVNLLQGVYVPELSRLRIYPPKVVRYEGDTIFFQVYYHDQVDRLITGTHYAVEWDITDGSGSLFDASDTSVYFVAGTADTTTLSVSYNDLSNTAQIITREVVNSLTERTSPATFRVFPNPADDIVYIQTEAVKGSLGIQLTDLNGRVFYKKDYSALRSPQNLQIKTDHLPAGVYMIHFNNEGITHSERVIIQ